MKEMVKEKVKEKEKMVKQISKEREQKQNTINLDFFLNKEIYRKRGRIMSKRRSPEAG